jgi:hypothetical protein
VIACPGARASSAQNDASPARAGTSHGRRRRHDERGVPAGGASGEGVTVAVAVAGVAAGGCVFDGGAYGGPAGVGAVVVKAGGTYAGLAVLAAVGGTMIGGGGVYGVQAASSSSRTDNRASVFITMVPLLLAAPRVWP